MEYTVAWVIQVWADGVQDAANIAHQIMLHSDNTALVFKVEDTTNKRSYQVDLFENTITPE